MVGIITATQKQCSPEAISALFVYALNDKLDEAKNVADWGSEIFKITSQIEAVFQEVINKVESTFFTKEGLQHFQETLAFMKKSKSDYALHYSEIGVTMMKKEDCLVLKPMKKVRLFIV